MPLTIHSMKEKRKFNKTEAQEFIQHAKDVYMVSEEVASYLVGFKHEIKEGEKTLVKNGEARNPKDNFMPRLEGLELFPEMIEKLQTYAPTIIESRNKKDETRLNTIVEPLYNVQTLVNSVWREVEIDYFMASNDVIYKEMLIDFAKFIVVFEEIRKIVIKKAKQDKRVEEFYLDIYKNYNPKTNWFSFILEDILSLGAGFESPHSGIPVNLFEWKKTFYDTLKEKKAELKEELTEKGIKC